MAETKFTPFRDKPMEYAVTARQLAADLTHFHEALQLLYDRTHILVTKASGGWIVMTQDNRTKVFVTFGQAFDYALEISCRLVEPPKTEPLDG